MNTRSFTLALVIALLSMALVHTYIEDQKASLIDKYGKEVSVVVAKVDINELDLVDDSKVAVTTVPRKFLAPGAIKSIKEIDNTIATVPILKGEQITKPRITYPGAKTGLSRQISVGKRAIAINVSPQQAVSQLIKPGDRVDILAAIDYSAGQKDRQKVQTILQDVLVLSTGFSMTNSIPIMGVKTPRVIKTMKLNTFSRYNTVALELSPNEIQKLTYLLTFTNARPYLSLRNNNDRTKIRPEATTTRLYDIFSTEAARNEAKRYFKEKNAQRRK